MFGFLRKSKAVQLDGSSQQDELKRRMQMANMTHNQTELVDIKQVHLREEGNKINMYFCNICPLKVHEHISDGDGGRIPDAVVLEGIRVKKGGFRDGSFTLKNVKLHSNGTIKVIATSKTELVPM